MDLKGKRILFIGPVFYTYHTNIVSELESLGMNVDFFAERSYSVYYEFSKKISKKLYKYNINRHLDNILKNIKDDYDYFLLIRGEIITTEFIDRIRNYNQTAKFIMYQWDTSTANKNFLKTMYKFDKIITFDRDDAKKYSLDYLPLFYIDMYKNLKLNSQRIYDIIFYGGYHTDRLKILKKIDKECNRLNLKFKYHLVIAPIPFLKRLLTNKIKLNELKYISFKNVTTSEILKNYKISKAVIDIEFSGQNGSTIRTVETLASGLKLITTNKKIKHEIFYDCAYINVIDKNNPKIDINFFETVSKTKNNMEEYSINSWLLNILK